MNPRQKITDVISQRFRLNVVIHEAMLICDAESIKNKSFFVIAKTDLESTSTETKKGANPKWNSMHSLKSQDGLLEFRIYEKSSFIR